MIVGRNAYRRDLPHYQSDQKTYFITFATDRRWTLPPIARDIALEHIVFDHDRRILLHAAVVMPDHVHLLLTPLWNESGQTFSLAAILQGIKGASSRRINSTLRRTGHVWQHESFDHELRHDESVLNKAEYIRQNPVRRGLVAVAEEYPWVLSAG